MYDGQVLATKRVVRGGSAHGNWRGHGQIPSTYWTNIRTAALKDNKLWQISIEYMDDLLSAQENLCALSRLPISVEKSVGSASIDRIDSTLGYVEGNVQWVHKDINAMKSNFPEDRFIELCKLVSGANQ